MATMAALFVADPCSISVARKKLGRLRIGDAFTLDRYIVEHPKWDARGHSYLPSRLETLSDLVGYFAARVILDEMRP